MFGHHWQPGEGTLVEVRSSSSGSGAKALVVQHFVFDVRPSSGQPFRTEVREPFMQSSFVAPSIPGELVRLKCDPEHKQARFDAPDRDEQLNNEAAALQALVEREDAEERAKGRTRSAED